MMWQKEHQLCEVWSLQLRPSSATSPFLTTSFNLFKLSFLWKMKLTTTMPTFTPAAIAVMIQSWKRDESH